MTVLRPELLAGTLFQWITWHPDDAVAAPVDSSADSPELSVSRVPIREFGAGLTIAPPGLVDVEITVFDTPTGLCALGTYRADRFTVPAVERFMDEFRSTMQACVRNPEAPLAWR